MAMPQSFNGHKIGQFKRKYKRHEGYEKHG